jgi:chromatin remodeling complex protein RSC6
VVPVVAAPAEEPENISSETRLAALEGQLQSINAIFSAVKTTVKDLRKVLSREKKAAEKSSKTKGAKKVNKDRKPSGFTKPTLISDELAQFLGKTVGTEMSRTEAAKEVIAYIQSHKLKDEKNGRIIHPDAALSALLKVTSADNLHFFNLQTFMKPHFIKTVPATTA